MTAPSLTVYFYLLLIVLDHDGDLSQLENCTQVTNQSPSEEALIGSAWIHDVKTSEIYCCLYQAPQLRWNW
jgi:hypothetical protein